MKLLFIFTGGTIGSTMHGDVISPDGTKSRKIIEAYRDKFGIDFEYDTVEPYTELSENNTGRNIRILTECIKANLNKNYDGIIVTHGTDTLQYSSAAIGYAIGLDTIPVCIISANRPIEHKKSNGLYNLNGAVKFIKGGLGRGAFTVYKNDTERKIKVHRATRLLAGKAFSDEVSSIFDSTYGYFDTKMNFIKNRAYTEKNDSLLPFDTNYLSESADAIAVLPSYPGIIYPTLDGKIKYVIMNSYHSGTVNTKSESALAFFREAARRDVTVFITGITEGPEYESAMLFANLGVIEIKNISPVAAYIKLWIALSSDTDPKDIMAKSVSGDIA